MSENDNAYNSSIRDDLDEVDWDSVLPQVLKYAVQVSKKFSWLGSKIDPEHLVQEAIARAYGIGTGETYRNWNKDTCPDIAVFLIGIIKSMTSHTAQHEAKFPKESIISEDDDIKEKELPATIDTAIGACKSKTPEEELIEIESIQELMNILERFENEDEELGMVILCIKDGIDKPRFIAEETGFEVSKVNSLLKKLRRKLKDFNPQNQEALC